MTASCAWEVALAGLPGQMLLEPGLWWRIWLGYGILFSFAGHLTRNRQSRSSR